MTQVIDKCYSSHLRRPFLEQESTLTLGGQVDAVGRKRSVGAKKPVSGKEVRKPPIGDRDKKKICFRDEDVFKGQEMPSA